VYNSSKLSIQIYHFAKSMSHSVVVVVVVVVVVC